MIVPSMTFKEIYDNLAKDLDKVEYRKKYYLSRAIKDFRKTRKFPTWRWYDVTVPSSGNKYIVFYYAENAQQINNPTCNSFFVYFENNKRFVIQWGASVIKQTQNHPMEAVREIRVFTSHFFLRYKERFLKDKALPSNDVACIFFSRNCYFMPIEINDSINKTISSYGENANRGFRLMTGFVTQ